jgi:hypothetical protein
LNAKEGRKKAGEDNSLLKGCRYLFNGFQFKKTVK